MAQRKIDGIGYHVGSWPLDPKKSTIVFIHGVGGTGLFWRSQIDSLIPRCNTLAIDLPGHGRSDGDGKDTIEGYAKAVIDLMKRIEVPNAIPCGLSMGGAVTLQLLLDYPDSLKAGILLNTGARLKVAPLIFEVLEKNFNDYVEMIGELVSSQNTDSTQLKRFQDEIARCKPEIIRKDFQACNSFDVMRRLGSIALPVLVVSTEDDQMTPPKYGAYLKDNIPNASWTHIMDAGHFLPLEKPHQFQKAIEEFVMPGPAEPELKIEN